MIYSTILLNVFIFINYINTSFVFFLVKADSNFNFNNHKTSLDKDVKIKEKAFSEKG